MTNGTPAQYPTIAIGWDEKIQNVRLAFKHDEFKSWDFVIAILRMALDQAEAQRRLQQMNAMQQMAVDQANTQRIIRDIERG